jgi:glycosyltransferase involved in cell wall biosynthesis
MNAQQAAYNFDLVERHLADEGVFHMLEHLHSPEPDLIMKPKAGRAACDVVIPAHNAEPYIAAAIDSLLTQSRAASRIIIINDQSTDRTAEAAAAFGGRVEIVDGHGTGAGAARNLGVRHSDSDLIAFLDADDVCRPDRLRLQVEALIGNPDAAMVFCDAEYTDASGEPTGALFTCPEFAREAFLGQLFERNRVLTTSAAMVRRSAFDAVGGFDEHLSHAEDYDLWLRLAGAGAVEHIGESLLLYRLHASNLSRNREALRLCEIEILNKHAVQEIRSALLATYGRPAQADLALSRVLFRMERYREGETLLRGVDPGAPDRALRHFLLGNFAVKRDDLEAAAAEYGQCLACDPAFAPAHNNLGVIAAAQGRRRQSQEHFIKAADLRPGYSDPRRNLEQEQRGSDLRYTLTPLRAVLRPD